MLTPQELKVVMLTLSQRHAWLKKTLEEKTHEPEVKQEHLEALKLLDSAIQKFGATLAPLKAKNAAGTSKSKPEESLPPLKSYSEARVLVAEDTEDCATFLIEALADIGIKMIDHAKDGWDAFAYIKKAELPYHLILCDWEMPELSGLEVHNKAKASNTMRGAHFIMVTAITEAPKIKQAVQQGISDYLVKPIDIQTLETKISDALKLPITRSEQKL